MAGTTAPGPDVAAQTREVLRRIGSALQEVGAELSDVVRTRIFVTDIGQWAAVGSAHREVFGDIRPAATMVQVAALISPICWSRSRPMPMSPTAARRSRRAPKRSL